MKIIKKAKLGGGELRIEKTMFGTYRLVQENKKIKYYDIIKTTRDYDKALKYFRTFKRGTDESGLY